MTIKHFPSCRASVLIAAALLAAALVGLVAAEKPAQGAAYETNGGTNGLIVFTSDRDTPPDLRANQQYNDRIYAMAPNKGSKAISLTITTYPTADQWPALSPDGTKVAFQRFQGGSTFFTSSEIYRMDVEDNNGDGNGDNLTQLTNNSTWDSKPAWSPDGKKIAFYSWRDNDYELYVMDSNGRNQTRLTNSLRFDGLPAWSPDGKNIAFVSRRLDASNPEGDAEIYVMNAKDGSSPINLTNNTVEDSFYPNLIRFANSQLAWSPDGNKIAFQRWESDGSVDIYTMDLIRDPITGAITGASTPKNLTNTPGLDERYPAWSPDGTQIAFWKGFLDSNAEIYAVNADGSGTPKNLTNNNFGDIQPDWGAITKQQCDVFAGGQYIYDVLGFASEDACRIAAGG